MEDRIMGSFSLPLNSTTALRLRSGAAFSLTPNDYFEPLSWLPTCCGIPYPVWNSLSVVEFPICCGIPQQAAARSEGPPPMPGPVGRAAAGKKNTAGQGGMPQKKGAKTQRVDKNNG